MAFEDAPNWVMVLRRPSSVGMVPVIRFPLTSNAIREERRESSGGIVPVRLLL